MKFIADFHIHSHYSRATSKQLTPENLEYWSKLKGLQVMGTGDCIHPGWFRELKKKIEPAGNGLYQLKSEYQIRTGLYPQFSKEPLNFILTTEISSIYKKNGKVRKSHNLCILPDFDAAEKFQAKLARVGNIASDGRPILGLDAKRLLEMLLETSEQAYLIPAHIWTPWFSTLGSKSGFDSIEECFEELTSEIFAVETGLSSDPPMNRACKFLDAFRLVSNSDAHSPEKLGREANLFDTEFSYEGIRQALKKDEGFLGTIEFFPQEGKYHYDGHRKCGICWDPLETIRHGSLCPECKTPVTRGVMYRVAELADRADPDAFKSKQTFYSITPLPELLAEIFQQGSATKKVRTEYQHLLARLGSEFHILLFESLSRIEKEAGPVLAEGIKRLRNGQIRAEDGYDGEFGRIRVFSEGELKAFEGTGKFSATPLKPKSSITFDIKAFKEFLYDHSGETVSP